MPKINGNIRTFAGFAAGTAIAAGWYSSTSALLSGAPAQTIPIIGAIAIAALTPTLVLRKPLTAAEPNPTESRAQQLQLLKTHTMVNVVDTQNLLVEVNDLLLQATGYEREELIGKPVGMLYADNNMEQAKEIRSRLQQGKGWQGETALRSRNGVACITQTTVTPLMDDDGTWIGSISARTDITKTTQLIAERDTAMTLHELRDDIWIVDEQTEVFKYMNRAAKRRFGWNQHSYKDMTLSEMAKSHGSKAILDACQRLKALSENFITFDASLFGKRFEVSIKWLHANTPDGKFLIMLNDKTDRLAQEQQQADFISMVSHELRSPLTSIKGSMGLLLSKAAGDLPPKAVGLLEIAHRNADRLVLIINDILDMEKISSGRLDFQIKKSDLSEMVEEALRANATAHQRYGLNIRCTGIDTPTMIQTDPNRIIQVLTNLMSNAAKFSKPGGNVDILVEKVPLGVQVSIIDEGLGIPEKDQHKIFQRFADMTNSDRALKGGTGLGLSICKAIVESLGGTIGFESREGQGTTFMFTLPTQTDHDSDKTVVPLFRSVG